MAEAATAAPPQEDPSRPSSDHEASKPFWQMASDILAGVEAMRKSTLAGRIGAGAVPLANATAQEIEKARRGLFAQSPYLPKMPNEPDLEYDRRRSNAFLTNIYGDISTNLASKPFSKECQLVESTPEDLKKYSENIDGLGNNLHVFAKNTFKVALDKGITWIMCDYTKVPAGVTLADERAMGARPYWVHIPAERLLAIYSKFLNGVEIIFHARIDETITEIEGYEEKTHKRVRVIKREPITRAPDDPTIVGFHPATWELLQEKTEQIGGKDVSTWEQIDGGDITIGVIPLVPVLIGKRIGTTWQVEPPLRDLAYMQVKLFQMESNLDWTKELTAFPMLTGNGIKGTRPGSDGADVPIQVPVGPRGVLFAPPDGSGTHGQWQYLEPAGSSLSFLQSDIDKHKTEMRDLGMQPLTAANLTVVTTSNLSQKATSACQSWALSMKDALEQAWAVTGKWLKKPGEPEVFVYTDFSVKVDGADLADVASAEKDGVISKRLRFDEMKRRGVLSEDADWKKDQEEMANQHSNEVLKPEAHIDPITGMPIVVKPEPGTLNPPPKPPLKVRPGERIVN